VAYRESNGHVIDDVTSIPIRLGLNNSKTAGDAV